MIKSNSATFNKQVAELTQVLYGYRHFNKRIKHCFEKLGYNVKIVNGHIKCYYGNDLVTTIASTPSDLNAGHQAIRYIRAFWESKENK